MKSCPKPTYNFPLSLCCFLWWVLNGHFPIGWTYRTFPFCESSKFKFPYFHGCGWWFRFSRICNDNPKDFVYTGTSQSADYGTIFECSSAHRLLFLNLGSSMWVLWWFFRVTALLLHIHSVALQWPRSWCWSSYAL